MQNYIQNVYERLPELVCLGQYYSGHELLANINKPWKAIGVPPKAITFVCTCRCSNPDGVQ